MVDLHVLTQSIGDLDEQLVISSRSFQEFLSDSDT